MVQLDTVIQDNASASEEMASMAEELSGQSKQLSDVIFFQALIKKKNIQKRLIIVQDSGWQLSAYFIELLVQRELI